MKTIRMKHNHVVEGIGRLVGDVVTCLTHVANRLVDQGAAEYVPESEVRRNAQPISPNRMKFASLVKALDPHADDFAERVAQLQQEYVSRGLRHRKLMTVLVDQEAEFQQILPPGDTALLIDVLRAAVERFVVDRF